MLYRDFGRTGLKVSEFALGTGTLGRREDGTNDAAEALSIIEQYVDAGGNLIDSSEAYQGGKSEELIGEYVSGRREDIILLSKYSRSTQRIASHGRVGNHRKAMIQSVEGSLKCLRTDRIDLYMAHLDDGVTPVEEIMRGFDDLVSGGKILYPGLSNFPAWRTTRAATIAELRGWAPMASIEVEYNLLRRTIEREILPMARALNLGVLGYSPLAGGLLTAKRRNTASDQGRSTRPPVSTEADVNQILDALVSVASELETHPGTLALAWVSERGVVPILGARTTGQLVGNLRAADVHINAEQMNRLNEASLFPLGYPQDLLARVYDRS